MAPTTPSLTPEFMDVLSLPPPLLFSLFATLFCNPFSALVSAFNKQDERQANITALRLSSNPSSYYPLIPKFLLLLFLLLLLGFCSAGAGRHLAPGLLAAVVEQRKEWAGTVNKVQVLQPITVRAAAHVLHGGKGNLNLYQAADKVVCWLTSNSLSYLIPLCLIVVHGLD